MNLVRAKKNLGQHFLTDWNIARKIVDSLRSESTDNVLEVGPGMGVLTQFLIQKENINLKIIEIDPESADYMRLNFPGLKNKLIEADFLKINLENVFNSRFVIIGNFPYNISSQIFFKVIENRNLIQEVVGMVQKEVAERICSGPGSKTYGILSVLLQAFYHIDYLFTVNEKVFSPPPKVKSAAIRLSGNNRDNLGCDEGRFFTIVKTAFNQRRKMLRNSLKGAFGEVPGEFSALRPEQLSVEQFILLTRQIEPIH